MKKTTTGIAIVSLALLLAACAKKEEPAPAAEPTPAPAAEPAPAPEAAAPAADAAATPPAEGAGSSEDAAQSGGDKVSQ